MITIDCDDFNFRKSSLAAESFLFVISFLRTDLAREIENVVIFVRDPSTNNISPKANFCLLFLDGKMH